MHLRAAELFLRDLLAQGSLDHGRTGDQDLRGVLGHHGKMRRDEARGRQAGDGAERGGRDRHGGQRARDGPEARRGEHRVADRLGPRSGNAAAAAFVNADQRNPVAAGQLLGIDAFAQPRLVGRAAAHREVFAADNAAAAVDLAESEDEVGRSERFQGAVLVALGGAGAFAELAETAVVEQAVDPFAHGLTALVMLPLHPFGAAQFLRGVADLSNFLDFFVPAHAADPSMARPLRGAAHYEERSRRWKMALHCCVTPDATWRPSACSVSKICNRVLIAYR